MEIIIFNAFSWRVMTRFLTPGQLLLKRLDIAQAQNIPPYVIFHDSVLWELAIQRPDSLEAMRQISGVGEVKSKRYGIKFLRILEKFS